jgi:hypothetical protein
MFLKTTLKLLILLFVNAANAEVKLTENDILGGWQINSESINSDGSNAKELKSVWTFRPDGTMEGSSEDTNAHARISQIKATVKYSIEEGKIVKQASPGRSKLETCTAVEKNNNTMTLECNHIYFFMTKK